MIFRGIIIKDQIQMMHIDTYHLSLPTMKALLANADSGEQLKLDDDIIMEALMKRMDVNTGYKLKLFDNTSKIINGKILQNRSPINSILCIGCGFQMGEYIQSNVLDDSQKEYQFYSSLLPYHHHINEDTIDQNYAIYSLYQNQTLVQCLGITNMISYMLRDLISI
jgi:hypothetical protein